MKKRQEQKKDALETAFDHVFTDVEELIKNVASEHTLINMGQTVLDWMPFSAPKPDCLLRQSYINFYQQSESDEMAAGINEEYRDWLKQSRKDVELVQKKGLPLTPRNVRAAFMKQGPFAKKTKK